MANYYKPQSPIQSGEDFLYPITTADQLMKSDNSRRLEQAGLIVADNSTSLGGVAAGEYALKTDTAPDSSKLGGIAASSYALKTDTVSNSEKLGNVAASEYALKTYKAPDSSKLEGKTLATIKKEIYPVGAIYISTSSTSPASLFGGTWEQLKDRFLLGAGSAYAAGSTGGEATHKLSINEIPSHAGHLYGNAGGIDGKGDAKGAWLKEIKVDSTINTSYGWNYKNNEFYPANRSLGGGAAHNNMPPYLTVYMWKRVS